MTVVELATGIGEDFLRILDHLQAHEAALPNERIREIIGALNVLESNPRIGHPCERGNRELVIGRRSHGYVALYRYVVEIDTVFVLAIRSPREWLRIAPRPRPIAPGSYPAAHSGCRGLINIRSPQP